MNSKNIEDVTNSPEDWEDFALSLKSMEPGTQLVMTSLLTWMAVLVVVGK